MRRSLVLAVSLWSVASASAGDLYVAKGNAGAARPYATPETAAAKIQDALAVAGDGDTIHVGAGEYLLGWGEGLTVTNGVRIVGATGDPADVVVKGNGSVVRPFDLNHPDAVVAGLTITKGYVQQDQGSDVRIGSGGGMVSNCVISSGWAWNYYSGAGILLDGANAVVTHCDIFGHTINQDHEEKGVVAVDVRKGRLSNSLVRGNFNASAGNSIVRVRGADCCVENCTVVSNYAKSAYGILAAAGSTVRNCVVCECRRDGEPTAEEDRELAPWSGPSACFVNCAFDAAELPNGSCRTVDAAAFADFAKGDYSPAAGGPLVNAGIDYSPLAATDLAGNPRKAGSRVDIGCFERKGRVFCLSVR